MNVLIATQDTVFCRMLTLEFSEKGFSILCAKTREEMEEASQRKRDAILRVELEWVKRGARARSTKQKARLERYEELKIPRHRKRMVWWRYLPWHPDWGVLRWSWNISASPTARTS
jgi:hypothetical protein